MGMTADIAGAVVTFLNLQSLSIPFTAVRYYLPRFDNLDLATLVVAVVPRDIGIARETRGKWVQDYGIDVAVVKRVADDALATLDPLVALVEEIANVLAGERLTSPSCVCIGVAIDPIYAQEALDDPGLFMSVIRCSFRAWVTP